MFDIRKDSVRMGDEFTTVHGIRLTFVRLREAVALPVKRQRDQLIVALGRIIYDDEDGSYMNDLVHDDALFDALSQAQERQHARLENRAIIRGR